MLKKLIFCDALQRVWKPLATGVYKKWLWNDFTQGYDKVDRVVGWRTMRVKTKGGTVRWMQPCFWIFD